MRVTILLLGVVLFVSAQTFDVASVKPSPPVTEGRLRISIKGGPGTDDPGHLAFTNATLKMVLVEAFEMDNYRIFGLEWLNIDMFDIVAKVPPGTSKEQMHVMLRNLIAERFKMVWHRDQKEMTAYTLVVAKGGPKFKVSELPADAAGPGGRGPMRRGADGFPMSDPSRPGLLDMMTPGQERLACLRCTMSSLVERLSSRLNVPVTDASGLNGSYALSLTFAPEYTDAPGLVRSGASPPADENVRPLLVATQEQLGLKLEQKKVPVDVVVIDRVEKVPTEN